MPSIVEALGGVGGKQTISEAIGGVSGQQTISELVKGGVGSDLPIIFEAKIPASQFVDNFVDKTANIIGGSPEYYAEYEYGDVSNLLENKFYTCLIRIEDELDDSYLPFYVGQFKGEEAHFDELPLIASKYNRKLTIRTQYFDDESTRDTTANYIRNDLTDSSSVGNPIVHIVIL